IPVDCALNDYNDACQIIETMVRGGNKVLADFWRKFHEHLTAFANFTSTTVNAFEYSIAEHTSKPHLNMTTEDLASQASGGIPLDAIQETNTAILKIYLKHVPNVIKHGNVQKTTTVMGHYRLVFWEMQQFFNM
ncbi:unnamed protein product, partial [Didymodactylos carnosus]